MGFETNLYGTNSPLNLPAVELILHLICVTVILIVYIAYVLWRVSA